MGVRVCVCDRVMCMCARRKKSKIRSPSLCAFEGNVRHA